MFQKVRVITISALKLVEGLLFSSFFFFFLASPQNVWDPSSRPGIELGHPAMEAQSPNHWTTKEAL